MQKSAPASGRPVFRPFVKEGVEIARSRRRLPHWQQEGVTYFVTFRLGDSMPNEAMDRWTSKRNAWLAMRNIIPDKEGKFELSSLAPEQRKEYRQRFGEGFQAELDRGYGSCLLRKPANAAVMEEALRFFDHERYSLGDFVIMPNHVHVLLIPLQGHDLGSILKSWKAYSAKEINRLEGRSGALWQRESFDHIIRNSKQLQAVREYIRENPAKAGLSEGDCRVVVVEWEIEP